MRRFILPTVLSCIISICFDKGERRWTIGAVVITFFSSFSLFETKLFVAVRAKKRRVLADAGRGTIFTEIG